MHTHETEGYSIPKLAMGIWGKCTKDTTHFHRDDPTWSNIQLGLEMMSKETTCVAQIGWGGGVHCSTNGGPYPCDPII